MVAYLLTNLHKGNNWKKIPAFIWLLLFAVTSLFSQDLEDLSFGEDNSLDIATWNIEWFPKNGQITVEYVTNIIEQLELDVLAIQELDDTGMFNQMLDALPVYTGYYESSWFAGLAFIYKTETVEINNIYEIYTTSPYWSAFPRSPMVMDMNFMGENYFLINNHFKCCGDGILNFNNESDEEKRRYNAANLLKEYIDTNLSDKNVIVLGDLNDDIAEAPQNNVFQMILDDPDNYLFIDLGIANGSSSDWSYPSWPSHLDHILITNELFDELDNSDVQTITIDEYLDSGWNEYDQYISDHRPVAVKFIFNSNYNGDLNGDGGWNIQDIVLLIDCVLDDNCDETLGNNSCAGDTNGDGSFSVLDIVLLINCVLDDNCDEALGNGDDSCINPDEIYACDIFQEYTDFETILLTDAMGNILGTSGDGIWGECTSISVSSDEDTDDNGSIIVESMPFEYELFVYPNPFNLITSINLGVPQDGLLDLFIVNQNYERVATITNSYLNAGYHGLIWDTNDIPNGYYRAIAVFGENKCFRNLHKTN